MVFATITPRRSGRLVRARVGRAALVPRIALAGLAPALVRACRGGGGGTPGAGGREFVALPDVPGAGGTVFRPPRAPSARR